ncbi:MAG: hypothetical protein GY778_01895 [bacterium]|nr:hypothetical protein [bacterium]
MPYDDPDATDPLTLHGVVVQTEDDRAMRDMAECFVEEYLRSGSNAGEIVKMFQTQGYAGPHLAYQTLGSAAIERIIEQQLSLRGNRKPKAPGAPVGEQRISLPVLDS